MSAESATVSFRTEAGPVEWCKPVPQAQAHALAKH